MQEQTVIQINEEIPTTHYFVYGNKKYPFNLCLFSFSSKYFQNLPEILGENQCINLVDESSKKDFSFSDNIIQDFINYSHRQSISLSNKNVLELNYLGQKYQISSLVNFTNEFIKNHHKDLALKILIVHQNDSTYDISTYENILSENFSNYINDDRLFSLQIPTLHRILRKRQKKLINDEFFEFLFKCIDKYGIMASVLFSDFDFGNAKDEFVNRLLEEYSEKVDFHFIDSSLLVFLNQSKNSLIKKTYVFEEKNAEYQSIIDDLKNKLMNLENSKKNDDDIKRKNETMINKLNAEINQLKNEIDQLKNENDQLKNENDQLKNEIDQLKNEKGQFKNEIKHMDCLYKNQDFNGIFNFFRRNSDIEKEVEVTCSGVGYGNKNQITQLNDDNFVFKFSGENSWICFNFLKSKIVPTNYTIKTTYWSKAGAHLKSWKIEGSNNSKYWQLLDQQNDCICLRGPNLIHTFPIQNENKQNFKYIKITRTGPTWNGNDTLGINSFEIYGIID